MTTQKDLRFMTSAKLDRLEHVLSVRLRRLNSVGANHRLAMKLNATYLRVRADLERVWAYRRAVARQAHGQRLELIQRCRNEWRVVARFLARATHPLWGAFVGLSKKLAAGKSLSQRQLALWEGLSAETLGVLPCVVDDEDRGGCVWDAGAGKFVIW